MRFSHAKKFIDKWEGGYVNHPADRGKATNLGVTQAVYDRWRAANKRPPRSVRYIERREADEIYLNNYWYAAKCDRLPDMVDLFVFDTAVNMGPGRAVRFLQKAVGTTVDGGFGPATWAAVQKKSPANILLAMFEKREKKYLEIIANDPSQEVFRRGWLNRLDALRVRTRSFH